MDERERRSRMMEQKSDAEDDLLAFVRLFWRCVEPQTPLVLGWPMEAMADALMAVSDGHIKRLLINVFPGACKSLMLNVFFVAFEWLKRPHLRYISASYTSALTERDNQRLLRIVTDPVYRTCWPGVEIVREGMTKIETSATGWKLATSVGGTVTGQRANRVLLDDANNPYDVESDQVRGQTSLFLREVLPDRLNNLEEDAIISIQQRTHEEDATGVLAKYGTGYTWLSIPMEFDPLRIFPVVFRRNDDGEPVDVWCDPRSLDADGDELEGLYTDRHGKLSVQMGSPMAKVEGQLAWPARFPPESVEEQKRIKGPYAFDSQYNQLPGTRGGSIIKRDFWKPWTSETFPDFGTTFASLDTAVEQGTQNDYNALTTWGAFAAASGEPQIIITSAWRARMGLSELVARVAESCYRHKIDYLLIEKKTRGRDVHDEILRLYSSATWSTVLVDPGTQDKVNRLKAVEGLFSGDCRRDPVTGMDVFSGGMVWAPMTDWAEDVINECASFPTGAHDDLVDSTSMALGWVRKNGVALRKTEYEAEQTERRTYKRPARVPYAIARE